MARGLWEPADSAGSQDAGFSHALEPLRGPADRIGFAHAADPRRGIGHTQGGPGGPGGKLGVIGKSL